MRLLCLIIWLTASITVHANDWMYRTSSSLSGLTSQVWLQYPVAKNPISREFEGFIEYKTLLKGVELKGGNGIYLGMIGDADRTYLNGIQIGQTGMFPPSFNYNMDTERTYFIPASLPINNDNELKIVVYSKFLVNKGFNPKNFKIGSMGSLDFLKYQNEVENNFSKFIIPILCLVLTVVSFPLLAPKHLWNTQLMIFLIGLSSFVLGVCRGRLPYHFYDMLMIYKMTLVSSILTIWLVCVFMTKKCQNSIRFLPTALATALITWVIVSSTLVEAAGVGRIWFHISPLFLILAVYGNHKSSSLLSLRSLGLLTLIFTNLNDNLNDLRFISTQPLLQYGLGIFISLMIIDQLLGLKKSWEQYFMKEAQLEIDAELGKQAVQIAHDLRSPIEAIREGIGRLNQVPKEEQHTIDFGLSRMNEICDSLLRTNSSVKNPYSYKDLLSDIKGVVSEVQCKYKEKVTLSICFEANENGTNSSIPMDSARLKRAICNLLNNAIEATNLNGEIRLLVSNKDDQINIAIEDNGIGFSEKTDIAFSRGFTTKINGNGIGLSSTKEFIEASGGTISIENLKPGTRVNLTLPLFEPNIVIVENKKSIVLIDDDALVRFNWKRQGQKRNVQVHAFSSFESFLKVKYSFPSKTPIFIDSNLGEEKGEILSETLREHGYVSVFLTTGLPRHAIKTTEWISDVVCKSFEKAVLPRLSTLSEAQT